MESRTPSATSSSTDDTQMDSGTRSMDKDASRQTDRDSAPLSVSVSDRSPGLSALLSAATAGAHSRLLACKPLLRACARTQPLHALRAHDLHRQPLRAQPQKLRPLLLLRASHEELAVCHQKRSTAKTRRRLPAKNLTPSPSPSPRPSRGRKARHAKRTTKGRDFDGKTQSDAESEGEADDDADTELDEESTRGEDLLRVFEQERNGLRDAKSGDSEPARRARTRPWSPHSDGGVGTVVVRGVVSDSESLERLVLEDIVPRVYDKGVRKSVVTHAGETKVSANDAKGRGWPVPKAVANTDTLFYVQDIEGPSSGSSSSSSENPSAGRVLQTAARADPAQAHVHNGCRRAGKQKRRVCLPFAPTDESELHPGRQCQTAALNRRQ